MSVAAAEAGDVELDDEVAAEAARWRRPSSPAAGDGGSLFGERGDVSGDSRGRFGRFFLAAGASWSSTVRWRSSESEGEAGATVRRSTTVKEEREVTSCMMNSKKFSQRYRFDIVFNVVTDLDSGHDNNRQNFESRRSFDILWMP